MQRIILSALLCTVTLLAHAQTPTQWKKMDGDVTFFLVNDTGRNGFYLQRPFAQLLGEMAETIGPEAILAAGDTHHFNGVASVSDPLWQSNYEQIYAHPELMIEWWPILGNHEYRGDTQAVLDYADTSRRWAMPARYYSKHIEEDSTTMRLIFLDTTPLMDKYRADTVKYPDAHRQDIDTQLRWLDRELDSADEDWVVVIGHHPVYADTNKDESERTDMQRRVDKILRRHKNVDMYLCGHVHNFQHIRRPGSDIDYVVNSSAALARPKVKPVEGTVFASGAEGFSVLSATPDSLCLYMIDAAGVPIHTITRHN